MERRKAYLAFGILSLALAAIAASTTIGIYYFDPFATTGANDSYNYSPKKTYGGGGDLLVDDPPNAENGSSPQPNVSSDYDRTIDPPTEAGERTTVIESSDQGVSWPLYIMIVVSSVLAVLFVAISGRAYMESSRHENMVRNDLVDLISFNPGINLSTIRHELQLSQGAVSYHLRRLEKGGVIYSHKGIKERRYYPASMGYNQVEHLSASDEMRSIIANPTGARIVEVLRVEEATQSKIVSEVGVSPSTVHWHMDRMERVGIISKRREGRTVVYRLTMQRADT